MSKSITLESAFLIIKEGDNFSLIRECWDQVIAAYPNSNIRSLRKTIERLLESDNDTRFLSCLSKAVNYEGLNAQDAVDMKERMEPVRKDRVRIPMHLLQELRDSGDGEVYREACTILTKCFSNYVYDIMQRKFPTFVPKYRQDMYQEGMIGLLEAFRSWDPQRGAAFTTYAKFAVIKRIAAIVHAATGTTAFHITQHKRIEEAKKTLQESGFPVTEENIAILTGMKKETVKREIGISASQPGEYLDEVLTPGTEEEMYARSPEQLVIEKEEREALGEAVGDLPKIIASVIRLKYLSDKVKVTTKEIAAQLGLTEGQVKAYVSRGLEMLRKSPQMAAVYLDKLDTAERSLETIRLDQHKAQKEIRMEMEDLSMMMDETILIPVLDDKDEGIDVKNIPILDFLL